MHTAAPSGQWQQRRRRPARGGNHPNHTSTAEQRATHLQRGALELSAADKSWRQVGNVFRVIRQQMRSQRSLWGQKLKDAEQTFALMDSDGSGEMDLQKKRFTT